MAAPFVYTVLNEVKLTSAAQVIQIGGASQSNTGTSSTDSTAPLAGGQSSHVRVSAFGYQSSTFGIALSTPWDMTNGFLRFLSRCQLYTQVGNMNMRLATNKAQHDAGNYLRYDASAGSAMGNWYVPNTFNWDSVHPANMVAVGIAPALSSIGYIAINLRDKDGSTTSFWDFARIQNVQAVGTKAKVVIWHDDTVDYGARAMYNKMQPYGFVASEATEWGQIDVGSPTSSTSAQVRAYRAAGWSNGSHATTGNEHTDVTAASVANQAVRNKLVAGKFDALAEAGDFTYWGGLQAAVAYPIIQRLYRTGRWNTSGGQYPETQPPGDPALTKAYLVGQNETFATNWAPVLTNAIASKGIAQFVFHQNIYNDTQMIPEFDAMLAWLDQHRADIDVVSLPAAIRPLLVGYIVPTTLAVERQPLISGTPAIGEILSVSPGTWNVTPDSYTWQWNRSGTPISGATSRTYTLVTADGNQPISCTVTAKKAGFADVSVTSAATGPVDATLRYFADLFARTDSATSMGSTTVGGFAWTAVSGTWGITSNQAYDAAPTSHTQHLVVVNDGQADGTVSATLANSLVGVANVDGGSVFRYSDANNYWFTSFAGKLYKKVAGTVTQIGTTMSGGSLAAGNVVTVVLNGSSITAKINGTTFATTTDTFNQTATRHGLLGYGYNGAGRPQWSAASHNNATS
jgi:hypothetical protein